MKNLDKMTRVDMEVEILNCDELYDFIGGDENLDNISKMSDEEMRNRISDWIEEGDETFKF